jgi:release factor glutamine methyltransferase
MSATIQTALREAVRSLEAHAISEARPAAEILLADLLAVTRAHLYLDAHCPLSTTQHDLYRTCLQRRLRGEPVQYITGHQEFWSLEFEVNPHVLIPRPESELLVEHGVRFVQQWRQAQPQYPVEILDVGTGSGNLAISLAYTLPQSRVIGIDIALGALQVARRNGQRLGVAERVTWVGGDLVMPVRHDCQRFALCVGNLPYVAVSEWRQLPREIRDYEPTTALLAGEDGLACIQRLVSASPGLLAPGGTLLLEVGWQQAAAVMEIIRRCGAFQEVGGYRDFAGIERVIWARMP